MNKASCTGTQDIGISINDTNIRIERTSLYLANNCSLVENFYFVNISSFILSLNLISLLFAKHKLILCFPPTTHIFNIEIIMDATYSKVYFSILICAKMRFSIDVNKVCIGVISTSNRPVFT